MTMTNLKMFLSGNELTLTYLLDLILGPFAITFGVLAVVLFLAFDTRRPRDMSIFWLLPLLVWCLQASLRTLEFFNYQGMSFCWSSPPMPGEDLIVLFESLMVLGFLLLVQTVAVLIKNWRSRPLGLNPRHYATFVCGFLTVLVDSFFLHMCAR